MLSFCHLHAHTHTHTHTPEILSEPLERVTPTHFSMCSLRIGGFPGIVVVWLIKACNINAHFHVITNLLVVFQFHQLTLWCSLWQVPLHSGARLGSGVAFSYSVSLASFNLEHFHSLSLSFRTLRLVKKTNAPFSVIKCSSFGVCPMFPCQ